MAARSAARGPRSFDGLAEVVRCSSDSVQYKSVRNDNVSSWAVIPSRSYATP